MTQRRSFQSVHARWLSILIPLSVGLFEASSLPAQSQHQAPAPKLVPVPKAVPAPAAAPGVSVPGATELRVASEVTLKEDEAAAAILPRPDGLTADQVAKESVGSSHSVRARLAELDQALARLDQTTAEFLPRLTVRAAYTRLSNVSTDLSGGALVGALNPGPLGVGPCPLGGGECVLDSQGTPVGASSFAFDSPENNYSLSATLSIPISDYLLKLSDAAAGARANRVAAELSLRAERLKVQADARALFYEWLRAQARVAIAQKSVERTRARLRDAKPAFELGTITKADVMRLEALAAGTEQVVLEAIAFQKLTAIQLGLVMGRTESPEFVNGEDITQPLVPTSGTLESLTQEGLRTRLELKSLDEAARSTRLASKALAAGQLPKIEAFGDVTIANPNQRYFPLETRWRATWSIGASATWTVGDYFSSGATSREASAQARALAAQRAALADGVRQEIASFYLARSEAEGALAASRRELAASEEAYRVATDLYRVGRFTTTEVIEAEADLLSARLNELNARIRLRIAEVRLRHAAGRDIEPFG